MQPKSPFLQDVSHVHGVLGVTGHEQFENGRVNVVVVLVEVVLVEVVSVVLLVAISVVKFPASTFALTAITTWLPIANNNKRASAICWEVLWAGAEPPFS